MVSTRRIRDETTSSTNNNTKLDIPRLQAQLADIRKETNAKVKDLEKEFENCKLIQWQEFHTGYTAKIPASVKNMTIREFNATMGMDLLGMIVGTESSSSQQQPNATTTTTTTIASTSVMSTPSTNRQRNNSNTKTPSTVVRRRETLLYVVLLFVCVISSHSLIYLLTHLLTIAAINPTNTNSWQPFRKIPVSVPPLACRLVKAPLYHWPIPPTTMNWMLPPRILHWNNYKIYKIK